MAAEVTELLILWNLAELCPTFYEADIDLYTFKLLSEKDLRELVTPSGASVGQIVKLIARHRNFIATEASNTVQLQILDSVLINEDPAQEGKTNALADIPNDENNDTASAIIEVNDEPSTICCKELLALLKDDPLGSSLASKATLNREWREVLSSIIARKMLKDGGFDKLYRDADYTYWTKQIEAYYPGEKQSTFYIKYLKGPPVCSAKGIIFTKLNKLRREYNSLHGLHKKTQVQLQENDIATIEQEDLDLQADLQFLHNYQEPWYVVLEKWTLTFKLRINPLADQKTTIALYHDYPCLSSPRALELFQLDFDQLHPGCGEKLLEKWNVLSTPIVNLLKQNDAKAFGIINHQFIDVSAHKLAFLCLPYLFPVSLLKRKKDANETDFILRTARPTSLEKQEGFVTIVKSVIEINELLQKRQQRMLKWRTTMQPFVVVCGSLDAPEALYVVINTKKYLCTTLIRAVDFCFKAFHALHVSYPIECQSMWQFLQNYVYGIQTKWDKNYSILSEINTDLTKLQNEQ